MNNDLFKQQENKLCFHISMFSVEVKKKLNLQIFTVGSIFRYQCTSVFNLKFQSYVVAVLVEMLNNKLPLATQTLK